MNKLLQMGSFKRSVEGGGVDTEQVNDDAFASQDHPVRLPGPVQGVHWKQRQRSRVIRCKCGRTTWGKRKRQRNV